MRILTHIAKTDLFAARIVLNPDPAKLKHMPTLTAKSTHIPQQQKRAQTIKVNKTYSCLS